MNRQQRRVVDVLTHIEGNLDKNLSVERLGRLARTSKYHFHRQFSASIGIGAAKAIQLLRLKRASLQLVFESRPSVTQISLDAGFANVESFSRAFRKAFQQSPREFRNAPAWQVWRAKYLFLQRVRKQMQKVEIVHFKATKVAALEHRGSRDDVYNTTKRLIEWRRANGIGPDQGQTYGIHYTADNVSPPENYRVDLCISVEADVKPNPQGVVTKIIPANRCARIRHLGSREHVYSADYLNGEWLPKSGEVQADFPMFFHYVNVGPNVKDHEMITDVYLPLK